MLNLVMKLDELSKIQEKIENETIDKKTLEKYKKTFGLDDENICDYIRNYHDLFYAFKSAYERFLSEINNFKDIKPGTMFTHYDEVDETIETLNKLF